MTYILKSIMSILIEVMNIRNLKHNLIQVNFNKYTNPDNKSINKYYLLFIIYSLILMLF